MPPTRILLVDVNRVSLDTSTDMLEYPLGLLYVATALKTAFGDQVETRIVSYDDRADQPEKLRSLLADFKPQILGLRSLTMGRRPLHRLAGLAKDEGRVPLVIAGGPHATDSPEDVLGDPAFDAAVLGEGEGTAVDLVHTFRSGRSLETVRGLAIRGARGIRFTLPQLPCHNLDDLPVPDYRLIDFLGINKGHVDFSFRLDVPHANLFTSRGCPYRCLYCHHVFGKSFRAHSAERIFSEVRRLHEEYGIEKFQIIDDIFNFNRQRAMAFYDLVIKSGLKLVFSFPNGLRGDRVDGEEVAAMAEAGVRYIAYAIETGSPRVQKLIRKNLNLERIAETISLTTKRGIFTRGFFMIGFPGETEEEALMTADFASKSDLSLAIFFTVVYFPGTALYRLARQISPAQDFEWALEDDYVRTRDGPYAFTRETLEKIKIKAIREFYFSRRRLELAFKLMPKFYSQRDIDAMFLVQVISSQLKETDIEDPWCARKLHRYFLIADRFSQKRGFYV